MEIYALSGPSGTGKSTSALTYAYEKRIPAIIDDGLLIYNGKRTAGVSAKIEKNYIKAVKRATFHYEDHTKDVRKAIDLLAIDKILLIGTSVRMVDLISEKLKLGNIDHYVDIHDIRTSSEIKMALFTRKTKGDHLMPIPHIQVEPNVFKKIITQGIKIFSPKKELIGETTIVQPNFHKNTLHISERVFKSIAEYACNSFDTVFSCDKVDISLKALPSLKVELTIKYPFEGDLRKKLETIQQKLNEDFIQFLELELFSIDLRVTKMVKP